jgi:hypothetical protein
MLRQLNFKKLKRKLSLPDIDEFVVETCSRVIPNKNNKFVVLMIILCFARPCPKFIKCDLRLSDLMLF